MTKKAKTRAKTKAKTKGKTTADTRTREEGGVLFRGADGNLYFITNSVLKECRLSPKEQDDVETGLRNAFRSCIQVAGVSATDSVSASDGVPP